MKMSAKCQFISLSAALSSREEVLLQCQPRYEANPYHPCLKYWISRSCFSAASRVENVPRFFRLPVFLSAWRL